MFLDSLPNSTKILFKTLSQQNVLSDFYLSGGSGLALRLNHRQSEDLDFFTPNYFNPEQLLDKLKNIGNCSQIQIEKNTLNLFIDQVKLQFLHYPYELLEDFIKYQKIDIASVLDIACTKLITISARGSKKDFIDFYFIFQKYSLEYLFNQLEKKYQNLNYNQIHILKSLSYFVDANNQPDPKMIKTISWDEVKIEILKLAKNLTLA